MLTIGLTGGIGSGKSTVAKLFIARGVPVIDADLVARDLTMSNQLVLAEIVKKFGAELLQADGSLNRSALRKIIFSDKNSQQWLENFLHPLIRAEIKNRIEKIQSPYCIVVIPLLLETAPNPLINRILVVEAPEEERIRRTQLRDNISREEVKSIVQTQASPAERLARADDLIYNTGQPADLVPQINNLHDFYTMLAKQTATK